MSEPTNQNQDPKPQDQNQDPKPSDGTQKPGAGGQAEHMIPKSRFDEVNSKYKDMKKQLDELLTTQKEKDKALEEQERKAKEEQGKFKELYETAAKDLDTYKGQSETSTQRVQQLEAVINGLLEAKLENVPEEFRDLIPENLTPEQKLGWLNTAETKGLFKAQTPSTKETPLGGNTNPPGGATTDLNKLSPGQLLRIAYGQK